MCNVICSLCLSTTAVPLRANLYNARALTGSECSSATGSQRIGLAREFPEAPVWRNLSIDLSFLSGRRTISGIAARLATTPAGGDGGRTHVRDSLQRRRQTGKTATGRRVSKPLDRSICAARRGIFQTNEVLPLSNISNT